MSIILTVEDRLEIGKVVGNCRTLDERKRVRSELVELYGCSHQTISAISIAYCWDNHLPKDEDVDEWWQKRGEYSSDVKCEYRSKIKEFLKKSLGGRDFSKLKVVCLPGVHCWEIEDYIDLGFDPKNIWGIERDRRDFQLMKYRAKQFGINIVRSTLTKFFESCDIVFDVVVMDYKGQLCVGYLDDINAVKMAENGVLITNFWCRRELGPIQDELDYAYRRTKARLLSSKWFRDKETYPDNLFVNITDLANELSVPTLDQSRAAIACLIASRLNYKFNRTYDAYKNAHQKYEFWSVNIGQNDLFDYIFYVLNEFNGITEKSDVCLAIDTALPAVLLSYFKINTRSNFESFDYHSSARSKFYTTMISMGGITGRYHLEPTVFGLQLVNFMNGVGKFKIDNVGNLVYSGTDGHYTWDCETFLNMLDTCAAYSLYDLEHETDFNNMWSIEISDADLNAKYKSVGIERFDKMRSDKLKKDRKDRKKLLARKLSKR